MGPQVPPDFTPGSPVVPSTDPQATRVVDARLGGEGKSCRLAGGGGGQAGGGGAPAGLHWGPARLRRSVRESPSPTPANAPHKTPPTRPSKSIYSWSYAGALPWQQGNTGDLANRLASPMVLRGPCGWQGGCASLLWAEQTLPPSLLAGSPRPKPGPRGPGPGRGVLTLGPSSRSQERAGPAGTAGAGGGGEAPQGDRWPRCPLKGNTGWAAPPRGAVGGQS